MDERTSTLFHQIESAWFPNVPGTVQKGRYKFEEEMLVLDADTVWASVRIIWARYESLRWPGGIVM
jgi:hypothetical protein